MTKLKANVETPGAPNGVIYVMVKKKKDQCPKSTTAKLRKKTKEALV